MRGCPRPLARGWPVAGMDTSMHAAKLKKATSPKVAASTSVGRMGNQWCWSALMTARAVWLPLRVATTTC
jgi:hypothetical protein